MQFAYLFLYLVIMVNGFTTMPFHHFYEEETIFMASRLFLWTMQPFKIMSTLNEKNLLLLSVRVDTQLLLFEDRWMDGL